MEVRIGIFEMRARLFRSKWSLLDNIFWSFYAKIWLNAISEEWENM